MKTKTIHFSAQDLDEVPNEYFKQAIKQARENRKAGKGSPIFTDDEELIKKDPKKYMHSSKMREWLHTQGI